MLYVHKSSVNCSDHVGFWSLTQLMLISLIRVANLKRLHVLCFGVEGGKVTDHL